MSETITFWASRNPEGPYSPRIQLSNFCPKQLEGDQTHWYYWPDDPDDSFERAYVDYLSEESEKKLGLMDLRPGYARNLNTGEEIHISQAKELK